MKDIEQIIAELRADGVKAHPEEANTETLMELGQRLIHERLERRERKRPRTS